MTRRRLGIGAELAPLVLILACLAGSFGPDRGGLPPGEPGPRSPASPTVPRGGGAPVANQSPQGCGCSCRVVPAGHPAGVSRRIQHPPRLLPAEDPTPRVVAQLAAAEAEQLLEASRANRKAQALEEARQSAVAESERWRRRQSLIHSQINTLESKVRKVEIDLDAMALERDALEKEVDARKAAVARAKSRPGQAILPHKGPNGTWRRPIVVECRNGSAVIQPQGVEFGLLELEMGFGPATNQFVAAIAREAMRVQRQASPDGAPVVPYIFFLVRPDGIRPYYEARGRLETLGITFGYELADAEWEIEFPDLDDAATWDGSAPATSSDPLVTGTKPGVGVGAAAEDNDLPVWPGARPGGSGSGAGSDGKQPVHLRRAGTGPGAVWVPWCRLASVIDRWRGVRRPDHPWRRVDFRRDEGRRKRRYWLPARRQGNRSGPPTDSRDAARRHGHDGNA